ncbi:hypothetical protein H0H81_004246 [Sphagnurus paluster]|uniref:Uncharacterized protein n=1 Tax=Sphagnurus paluster TaxID=117069 RepID=A0A9P7KMI8_9AGAR|nr:hypothetical protein H0H81_004246 [Sphagnurus paluster]
MQLTRLLASAALVASAAAEFQILSPSSDVWWVAKSLNTLSWTCNDPSAPSNFTVLVANTSPTVLVSPLAIISIQYNYDCSKTITQDQLQAAPGTGYTILFANPLNSSDVSPTSFLSPIFPLLSSASAHGYRPHPGDCPPPPPLIPTKTETDKLPRTQVYASSQQFEIKPLGSTYPTATPGLPSPSASATSSGAGANATQSGSGKNGALSLSAGGAGALLGAVGVAAVGLLGL